MAKAKKEEAVEVIGNIATQIEKKFGLSATVVTLPESAKTSAKEDELVLTDELAALREIAPRISDSFAVLQTRVKYLDCEALAANAERIGEYGTNAEMVQNFKFYASQVVIAVDEANTAVDRILDAMAKVN